MNEEIKQIIIKFLREMKNRVPWDFEKNGDLIIRLSLLDGQLLESFRRYYIPKGEKQKNIKW